MISKSPNRNTFQKEKYLERKAEEGKTPDNDANVAAMLDYYSSWENIKSEYEADPNWQKNNLEYDLRTNDWILEKVRTRDDYAQNLYAAMCNRRFTRNDVWPILKNELWSCSWRSAGGIIADMRQQGDYMDWYCSGIRSDVSDQEYMSMTDEEKAQYEQCRNYVAEGNITDEVSQDLLRLGWLVSDED